MRATDIIGVALVALAFGCQPEIGDACLSSTDCSRTEIRQCDLSYRPQGVQGECIIEGCGRETCPEEGTCVMTYSVRFNSVACDPEREDKAACRRDETGECIETLAPLDACSPEEICLPEGLCANQLTSRTSCRRKCNSNRECRAGYHCRLTGSNGVYRSPNPDDPYDSSQVHICVPVGSE